MTFLSAEKEFGPGHAWLCLEQDASSDWKVEIEREASKDLYLGSNGWQGTPHGIQTLDAQGKKLLLGPEIVDYLRDGDLIVLRIPEADIEIEDYWLDVPISGRSSKGESLLGMPKAKETTGPKASYQADEPPQAHLSEPILPDLPPADDTGKKGGALKVVATGVALIIWFGLGALLWLYSDQVMDLINGEADQTQTAQIESSEEQDPASESSNASDANNDAQEPPAEQADANPNPDTQPVRGRAYWQELLGNDQLSGQELYAASQETRSETDLVDIAQDFLRLAADKGHSEALKEYAGLFDPMKDLRLGDRRIENPGTALEYYRRLSATGDQTATSDIESLCAHLKPKYFENADARIAIDDYCN